MAGMEETASILVNLLRKHSQPAAVCTEPAAIALAAARASETLGYAPRKLHVELSAHVLKNAKTAGLPVGDEVGPHVAAALGSRLRRSSLGLQMLLHSSEEELREAMQLIEDNGVEITEYDGDEPIYVRVTAFGDEHEAETTIAGGHSNIVSIRRDDSNIALPTSSESKPEAHSTRDLKNATLSEIIEANDHITCENAAFLLRGAQSNMEVAEESLRDFPFWVRGEILPEAPEGGLCFRIRRLVMAAIWARMAGTSRPIFTSAGSGNQGIMVSIPPICVAQEREPAGKDATLRAVLLAHTINLYFKAFMGDVSDYCGAISAGAGVAGATCRLMGGNVEEMRAAVNAAMSALDGMTCDGARINCSLKGATAAVEGVMSGWMAANGLSLPPADGPVARSLNDNPGRSPIPGVTD